MWRLGECDETLPPTWRKKRCCFWEAKDSLRCLPDRGIYPFRETNVCLAIESSLVFSNEICSAPFMRRTTHCSATVCELSSPIRLPLGTSRSWHAISFHDFSSLFYVSFVVNDGKGLQKTKKKRFSSPWKFSLFFSFTQQPTSLPLSQSSLAVFPFSFSRFCSLVSLKKRKTPISQTR